MNKPTPPDSFKSPRLTFRKHDLAQAETMFTDIDRDRARLRQHLPWVDFTLDVEDERNYIRMSLDAWDDRMLFDYAIFRSNDGRYVGNVSAHTIAWGEMKCELGYWLLGEFEGQGFMVEAVRTLENELFRIGFKHVEIRCHSKNRKSASVPRRCGYRLDAVQRRDGLEGGGVLDVLVFAKEDAATISKAELPFLNFGLEAAMVFSNDIEGSRAFYKAALGIEPQLDEPEICEFRVGTQSLVIHRAEPTSVVGHVVYWLVPDLDQAIHEFGKLGASLHRGPVDIGGARICQIQDPFGGILGLRGR